jgi:hypothetical protein
MLENKGFPAFQRLAKQAKASRSSAFGMTFAVSQAEASGLNRESRASEARFPVLPVSFWR